MVSVAKSAGGHFLCENRVDEFLLRTRKNVTDLSPGDLGIVLSLL